VLSSQEEPREREEVMRQDADWQRQLKAAAKAPANTMFQHAQSHANDEAGGRFTQVNAATVVGSKAEVAAVYPAASAAHQTQLPPEEPLGYRIDAIEPSTFLYSVEDPGGAEAPSSSNVEHAAP
jgi:hypothetical protein